MYCMLKLWLEQMLKHLKKTKSKEEAPMAKEYLVDQTARDLYAKYIGYEKLGSITIEQQETTNAVEDVKRLVDARKAFWDYVYKLYPQFVGQDLVYTLSKNCIALRSQKTERDHIDLLLTSLKVMLTPIEKGTPNHAYYTEVLPYMLRELVDSTEKRLREEVK